MKNSRRRVCGLAVAIAVGVVGITAVLQSASAATAPAAPNNVHEIMSTKECGTLGAAASYCDGLIRGGGIMLAWKSGVPGLGGYTHTVYRVDGGRHDLVIAVYTTWAGLAKSKGPFPGRCYEVVTSLHSLQSRPSSRFCAGRDPTATVKTFSPSQSASLSTSRVGLQKGDNACGLNIQGSQIFSGLTNVFGSLFASFFSYLNTGIDAGNTALPWTHIGNNATLESGGLGSPFIINSSTQAFSFLQCGTLGSYRTTNNYASSYDSIGAAFPLGALSQHRVFSATLTMGMGPSTVIKSGKVTRLSGVSTRTGDYLCVRDAQAAVAPWWTAADPNLWGYHTQKASFALGSGVLVTADVTSIVQTWANDRDAGDDGFILRGALDPTTRPGILPSAGLAACLTQFGTPKLEVVYF